MLKVTIENGDFVMKGTFNKKAVGIQPDSFFVLVCVNLHQQKRQ